MALHALFTYVDMRWALILNIGSSILIEIEIDSINVLLTLKILFQLSINSQFTLLTHSRMQSTYDLMHHTKL